MPISTAVNMLNNSRDLFGKLNYDYTEFKKDPLSIYKALDVSYSAWHLTDWVFKEYERPDYVVPGINEDNALGNMRADFYKKCDPLKIMHDIANGAKHMTLSHRRTDMSGVEIRQEDLYTDTYSDTYGEYYLTIKFASGDSRNLLFLFEEVIKFWTVYFSNKS